MPCAVRLSPAAHAALVHALASGDAREPVALLGGPADDPGAVTACPALANVAVAGDAFVVEPTAFARAEATLRERGLVFRCFAHGHGDGSAHPSAADRATLWRDCVQLIGARGEHGPVLRAFWLLADGTPLPLPCTIVAEAS